MKWHRSLRGVGGSVEGWAKSLSNLLRAGVSLPVALQTQSLRGDEIASRLYESLSRGRSFRDGLKENPEGFKQWELTLLGAYETAGNLEKGLSELGTHREVSRKRKRTLLGALIYPALLLITSGFVLGFLTFWVFPRFLEILNGYGGFEGLPWATRTVIGSVKFFQEGGYWLPPGLLCVFLGVLWLLDFHAVCRRYREYWFRHCVPCWGFWRDYRKSRICGVLSPLLESGLGVSQIKSTISGDIRGRWTLDCLTCFHEKLESGERVVAALVQAEIVDEQDRLLLESAEEGGQLPEMLEIYSREAEARFNQAVDTGIRLLEPSLLLAMAAVVLVMVLSFVSPLIKVMQQGQIL